MNVQQPQWGYFRARTGSVVAHVAVAGMGPASMHPACMALYVLFSKEVVPLGRGLASWLLTICHVVPLSRLLAAGALVSTVGNKGRTALQPREPKQQQQQHQH
jgi:hypothetical protein